jgi:hypothetical protein
MRLAKKTPNGVASAQMRAVNSSLRTTVNASSTSPDEKHVMPAWAVLDCRMSRVSRSRSGGPSKRV